MPEGYEVPPRKVPDSDDGYLEQMTAAVFRAGFSWQVVADKWAEIRKSFDGFDVGMVANYDDSDIDRLLANPKIIRNGRKIEATIYNAQVIRDLSAQHGSLHNYLRTLDTMPYAARRKALHKRFKNLGPTSVFVFLYTVGEDVPEWEERNK